MRKRIAVPEKVYKGDTGYVNQGLDKYQLQLRMFCYIRNQQH